jgi:hypothetical protein
VLGRLGAFAAQNSDDTVEPGVHSLGVDLIEDGADLG